MISKLLNPNNKALTKYKVKRIIPKTVKIKLIFLINKEMINSNNAIITKTNNIGKIRIFIN